MTVFASPYPDVDITDQTITERVFAGLAQRINETVLTNGVSGHSLTAGEFMDQVKRMAGGLTSKGIGKGHVVALMAPNNPEYCVIFHAVAWSGGTITTLNPTYTASEISHQRAGRIINPGGATIISMAANDEIESEFSHILERLRCST